MCALQYVAAAGELVTSKAALSAARQESAALQRTHEQIAAEVGRLRAREETGTAQLLRTAQDVASMTAELEGFQAMADGSDEKVEPMTTAATPTPLPLIEQRLPPSAASAPRGLWRRCIGVILEKGAGLKPAALRLQAARKMHLARTVRKPHDAPIIRSF